MIKRFYILLLAIVASVGMNAKDPELPGAFSINANGDKIVFSRGNLQATTTDLGANWTWDFAPNQWSFIGDAVANTSLNGNKTVSTNGTVDLFGWSTAATYYGIHNSNNKADYSGDFVDWGNTMTGEWRTLSKAEWRYIIYDRKNAYQKRSQATVNGVQGYVLLPDTWTLPSGLSFTNNTNNYTTNQYEGTDWDAMENAGAVFLPAGGDRTKASVSLYGYGWYWASTPNDEDGGKAYYFYFYETSIGITEYNRSDGRSVRLVTAAPVPAYEAVMNLIDAIPATIEKTDACKNAIEAARAAYDALSTADKALVTNYSTLTAAEAAWAVLPLGKWDSGDCEVILSQGGIMTVSKKAGEGNGAMDNYAKDSAQPWKDYRADVKSLVIESGVTELGSYAFYGLTYLEGDMVIPEGVTALHENTFYGNYKLTSVTLPSTTTLLGDKYNAFYGCVNVTDVYLPANPVNLVWNEDKDDFNTDGSTVCHVPSDFYELYVAKFITGVEESKQPNVTFAGDMDPGLTEAQRQAINDVKGFITAIPQPVVYNEACDIAITDARTAYDALDEGLKPFIINYTTLLNAEDAYAKAKADTEDAVEHAIGKIDAIPAEIEYNADCKEAIEDARATYDALTEEQKALVSAEELKKLTDAEEAWTELAAEIEHNVQFMTGKTVLAKETIALTKLPNGAPEVNGFAFDHWEVLPTPMAAGLHLQAIYRSLITVDPVAFDTLMYNGIAQNLIKAGEAEEGHLEYRIGEDGAWSAALPQATNAGEYLVQYKLVRDGKPDYIVPVIIPVNIAKAPVSYVAPAAYDTLVYNAAAQTLIEAGKTNDGTFEYSLDPQAEDSWKAELPQGLNAGDYAVSFRVIGDANHLDSIAPNPVEVAIAKAKLTATADDKTVTYGDAVPEYTVTYAGWQGADDANVLTGKITFACEYAPTSNVGEYAIVPSGVDAANYSITFVNGKVTVNQAPLMITAEDKTVTYGDAIPTYTATYEGWKNQDKESVVSGLTYTCEYAVTSNVGEYTIVPSGATALNYNISYTNGKVTVNQAALTITADDKEVEYGEQAPEFTASYEGWKNGDDASVVSGLKYTCDYLVTSNVGDYTIIPSDATAMNYSISFVNGTLKVNQAPLMITADDKTVIYGDAIPEYTPSYEGWKNDDGEEVLSGLTFTCEYAPTSNVGEYPIVPSGATATNYAISYTNGKVTVNKAALTITADDKTVIYGDEHPEFTASYSGWKNQDDESVVSGLAYTCSYAPGSYIGTYAIEPNSATALNYEITFVNGTLTVNRAVVTVSDAEAQIAKFADGHAGAVVLNNGKLNGIKLNDPISHITTATFSSAEVREHLTITLFYELTGNAALLNNYNLDPTSEVFSTEGVIIEPFIPDDEHQPEEGEQVEVEEGIDVYAYGYCDGNGYSLKYHLNSGNPDQYKIDFADSRFYNVDWTDLVNAGKDGTIEIIIPEKVPTGDYSMTVYFRDSRFPWLESRALTVTFHVNIPETYVTPLFENIIALVDTCNCFTDIQWYYRANDGEPWNPIEGATGFYYRVNDKLTGQYFVSAKMNGEHTYTCGQADMETLYGADKPPVVTVHAYPNPVITTTTVTIENSESNEHDLRIVNLKGVEMFNTKFQGNKTVVDMNGYLQGYYMISVDGVTVKVLKK